MRRVVPFVVIAIVATLAGACKEDPVVLASLGPGEGPPPVGEQRCTSDECASGSYCERPTCAAPAGLCVPLPTRCPIDEAPVCGCNGITYWNDCFRMAAGVGSSIPGECGREALGCRDSSECPPSASCWLLADSLECDRELRGRCWVVPAECPPPGPDRFEPCVPMPPGPEPPPPVPCVELCGAIRSGAPHHRALRCGD